MYKIIKLDVHQDERGYLAAIESNRNIPFDIKRVFYIFNVKQDAKRAQHANMKAQEIVLCLNGCCEVLIDDGKGQRVSVRLNGSNEAVHIEPKKWVEISDFSEECLILAVSDSYYDRRHQIDDYQEFCRAVE